MARADELFPLGSGVRGNCETCKDRCSLTECADPLPGSSPSLLATRERQLMGPSLKRGSPRTTEKTSLGRPRRNPPSNYFRKGAGVGARCPSARTDARTDAGASTGALAAHAGALLVLVFVKDGRAARILPGRHQGPGKRHGCPNGRSYARLSRAETKCGFSSDARFPPQQRSSSFSPAWSNHKAP